MSKLSKNLDYMLGRKRSTFYLFYYHKCKSDVYFIQAFLALCYHVMCFSLVSVYPIVKYIVSVSLSRKIKCNIIFTDFIWCFDCEAINKSKCSV